MTPDLRRSGSIWRGLEGGSAECAFSVPYAGTAASRSAPPSPRETEGSNPFSSSGESVSRATLSLTIRDTNLYFRSIASQTSNQERSGTVPANKLEQLHGGVGVMADDLMAGIYANLALRIIVAASNLVVR